MTAKREELAALAACPFCGAEGETLIHGHRYPEGSSDKEPAVWCPTCDCKGPLKSWNTRAQASASPPEREAKLREALEQLQAFVSIMFGSGPDAKIPDVVRSPLGIDIKLGKIMNHAEVALFSRDDGEAKTSAACNRCQGNGEIVTDWSRYTNPHQGDTGEEALSECPDCDGKGVVPSEAPSTIPADVLAMKEAAYKAAWNAYVEASMCPEIKTFDCIKRAVDAAISRLDVPGKTAGKQYVVRKGGYFYRPKAQGYTSSIHEAGLWPKDEAGKYAIGVEGVTVHPASEWFALVGNDDLDTRFKRLQAEASDLGYQLVQEPDHPDSPHNRPAPAAEQGGETVSVEELEHFIDVRANTFLSDWSGDLARALLDKYSIRPALMTEGIE